MSYSKTTWKTGDTITAQLLNHAEDGIAANDAAIAALPAGLQLYGPYVAHATATVSAGATGELTCESMEDFNGSSVTFPDAATDADVFVISVTVTTALLTGFSGPILVSGGSGPEWQSGIINVYNNGESSSSVYANMLFYSTVEFPQES